MEFRSRRQKGPSPDTCGTCHRACHDNSIECSSCKFRIHQRCVPMTATLLDAWEAPRLDFVCPKCAFVSADKYDTKAALARLAGCIASPRALSRVVRSETLLEQTYGIRLPVFRAVPPGTLPGTRDRTATAILKMLQPGLLESHIPLRVFGDGNCLFRALSRALYGSEEKHDLLRLMTAMEVAIFPNFYDPESPSCKSLVGDRRIDVPNYKETLSSVSTPGAYMDMISIYAASAVIGMPISVSRYYCHVTSDYVSQTPRPSYLPRAQLVQSVMLSESDASGNR